MIESYLKELSTIPWKESGSREGGEENSGDEETVNALMAALPVVRKIVGRRRITGWGRDGTDLIQEIFFRLLRWRNKRLFKKQ